MKTKQALAALFLTFCALPFVNAQGTAFTYQGRLNASAAPANGMYDFSFALFSGNSTNTGQVGPTLTNLGVGVTNGLFTTTLDFGSNFTGANRWLSIALRTNAGGVFTSLSPLQPVTPAPYAMFAPNSGLAITATSANSVAAGNITGTLNSTQLPANVVLNGQSGVTLAGAFSGDGSGLTSLSSSQLTGPISTNVLPGFQSPSYSTVGGGQANASTQLYGTVAGGKNNTNTALYGAIGGGLGNVVSGIIGTVAGGENNQSTVNGAVVGGGFGNTSSGTDSVVAGGQANVASGVSAFIGGGGNNGTNIQGNAASGAASVVGGGFNNTNSGNYATIPGGVSNLATGHYSFAAGFGARATNNGSFVWADAQGTNFASTKTNQFSVRASGGVVFATGGAGIQVDGVSVVTAAPGSIQGYEIDDGGASAYGAFQQAVQSVGGDTSLAFSNLFAITITNGGSGSISLTVNGAAFGTVIGFSGNEAISSNYTFAVEVSTSSAVTAPDSEIGLTASVTIVRNGRSTTYAGIVSGCTLSGAAGSTYFYTVQISSPLVNLALNKDYHIFQQNSVETVAGIVYNTDFPGGSITDNTTGSNSTHESLTQFAETDLNFFNRLLENEGIFYYFNDSVSPPVLIFGDSTAGYSTSPNSPFAYYGNAATNIPAGAEYIRAFQKASHQNTRAAIVNSFNFQSPNISYSETASTGSGTGTNYEFGNTLGSTTYNQSLANDRAAAQAARHQLLFGAAAAPDLRAGSTFTITDNSGAGLGGSYVVVSIHHAAFVRVTNGVSTIFYGNEFEALPAGATYRPPLRSPRPVAQPSTGIIAASAGTDILTDQWGRVKVSFNWDRRSSGDQSSSEWVRLATPWAGNGRGFMFLPRVGDEVLVSFIDGDPDQPVVVGSLFDLNNPVPYALPANKTTSVIRTGDTPSGTGYNEIKFVDTTGSEQLSLTAQKDFIVTVKNNETESVSGTVSVSASQINHSGTAQGGFNSAVEVIKNLDATTNSAPALRVIAQGSPVYGALSVSTGGPVSATNTNNIISFGNANQFVSWLDNNGNWFAKGTFSANTFINLSDRNSKENFSQISPRQVLDKVAALPLTRWNYKDDKATEHIGPMAQDFHAAFNVGPDEKHISTVDEGGVALAAIQGLNQKLDEKDAEIKDLRQQLEDLQKCVKLLSSKNNQN